jgi:ATP synthase protein I
MAARDGRSDEAGDATSDADLARRLDRLSRDLDAGRQDREAAERPQRGEAANYGQAFRLSSEFVAGVIVGAVLGWGLDRLAGTSPWGLIVFLLLGFCAGVLNVVRASAQMTASGPSGSDAGAGRSDEKLGD